MQSEHQIATGSGIETDVLRRLRLIQEIHSFTEEELKRLADLLRQKSGLAEAQTQVADANFEYEMLSSLRAVPIISREKSKAYETAYYCLDYIVKICDKIIKHLPRPLKIDQLLELLAEPANLDSIIEFGQLASSSNYILIPIDELLEIA